MARNQKKQDKEKAEAYLKRLLLARTATAIDAAESLTDQMNRIRDAQNDVRFMVKTYLPHYATAESAAFQIEYANLVANNPLFKGFAEWGGAAWQSRYGVMLLFRFGCGCAARKFFSV